jgi:MFS family permease
MLFQTKKELSTEDINVGLKYILKDGYKSQVMVSLTSGAFIISYALLLGASYFIIGILAAIPSLSHLVQIPALYLLEKIRNRRIITIVSLLFYRISIFILIFLPFFFSNEKRLIIFIIVTSLLSICSSIAQTSWLSWMHDIVPQKILGSFFSRRITLSTILGMLISFIAALFIDSTTIQGKSIELYSYSLLFIFAFIFGMISIYLISKIPEPSMCVLKTKLNLKEMLSEPFKDKNYRNLLTFLLIWNFAVNLASPFFIIYMLKNLRISLTLVIILTILSQSTNLISLKIWGIIIDKYSNKSVLKICGPLFLFCIFVWTYTTFPSIYPFTLPLLIIIHIFMGISMAGIVLATGNICLKLAPKELGSTFLAVTSIIISLGVGLAPILGSIFIDYFETADFSWSLEWVSQNGSFSFKILSLQGWDFFFIIAFLLGIFSLHKLALIKEVGEVDKKIIFHEINLMLRKSINNISSLGGLRLRMHAPFYLVRMPYKQEQGKNDCILQNQKHII